MSAAAAATPGPAECQVQYLADQIGFSYTWDPLDPSKLVLLHRRLQGLVGEVYRQSWAERIDSLWNLVEDPHRRELPELGLPIRGLFYYLMRGVAL